MSEEEILKAIHKYCLWCCGGSEKIVFECKCSPTAEKATHCKLWVYRLGTNPDAYEQKKQKMLKARELIKN